MPETKKPQVKKAGGDAEARTTPVRSDRPATGAPQRPLEARKIRIKQVRSGIACPKGHKEVLRGLGFRRLNQVVERPDNAGIRGMIFKVRHLVEVVNE